MFCGSVSSVSFLTHSLSFFIPYSLVVQAIVLGQCAHVFCTDCLQAHVTTCTSEGKTLIVCPSQCGAEVTQAELREVVGLEHFNTIDRKQMEAAVALPQIAVTSCVGQAKKTAYHCAIVLFATRNLVLCVVFHPTTMA
jgi:hypothetical protein